MEKGNKEVFFDGGNLVINSKNQKLITQVRQDVELFLKTYGCEVSAFLKYIKKNDTLVYVTPFARKVLPLIGEEIGFITEQRGKKGLLLSILIGNGIKFRTEPMFLLDSENINPFYLLLHFYKWYSYKKGLPGFDYDSQEDFKQYMRGRPMEKLPMKKIIQLEQAVARDKEATDFVLEFRKSTDGAKNAMNKIKNQGSANI